MPCRFFHCTWDRSYRLERVSRAAARHCLAPSPQGDIEFGAVAPEHELLPAPALAAPAAAVQRGNARRQTYFTSQPLVGAAAAPASPEEATADEDAALATAFPEEQQFMQESIRRFHTEVSSLREEFQELRRSLAVSLYVCPVRLNEAFLADAVVSHGQVVRERDEAAAASMDAQESRELREGMRQEVAVVSKSALLCKKRLDRLHSANIELEQDYRLAQVRCYPAEPAHVTRSSPWSNSRPSLPPSIHSSSLPMCACVAT